MATYEALTFKNEIKKKMIDIARVKPTLLVGFGAFSESDGVTASIVDIDEKREVIGISSLRDRSGNPVKPDNNQFYVITSVNGLTYRFSSKLRHAGFCNGVYEFNFPEVFEYLQRRAYYRVPLKSGEAAVTFDVGGVTPVKAQLQDISIAGMRVCTQGNSNIDFAVGDPVARCRLNIDGYEDIRFSATVRYTKSLSDDQCVMGFSIKDIDNVHQNLIERYVALRDMELRKQRVGM
jgi:c-di-GMP-binding flagellar brake protein YcgR